MLTLTKIERVQLFEEKPNVTLTSYIAGTSSEMPFNNKRKAILVIPGGGYSFCSDREGEPIAQYYLAMGFNSFVLNYSVHTKDTAATWPAPLVDASAAMKYIRDHAEEFHIDPDYVFVVGFSAGGHLAAALGTLWSDDEIERALGFEKGYNRPTGMILSYPVISGGEYAHRGSFDNILSERKDEPEAREELSLENCVSKDTVPAFIWSTRPDRTVPVQNSLLFALALADCDIPFEMHIYPKGGHGASLGNAIVGSGLHSISGWIDDSIRWMNGITVKS
ncbi:MAG: alpha/beta hydrolase [Ruminococcaceae bacterium]|nr:alpha/beta hydrolase [Oscillospiraceae bacterium]